MNLEPTQNAQVIGASAAILIVVWLVIWFFIWHASPKRPPLPLVVLFALSSAMSFVWFVTGTLLRLFFTPLDPTDVSSGVLDWTFNLPFTMFVSFDRLHPEFVNSLGDVGGLLFYYYCFLLSVEPAACPFPKAQRVTARREN